jgi:hypothetical protein
MLLYTLYTARESQEERVHETNLWFGSALLNTNDTTQKDFAKLQTPCKSIILYYKC